MEREQRTEVASGVRSLPDLNLEFGQFWVVIQPNNRLNEKKHLISMGTEKVLIKFPTHFNSRK